MRSLLIILLLSASFLQPTVLLSQTSVDEIIDQAELQYRTHDFQGSLATLEALLLRQSKTAYSDEQLERIYCFRGECFFELSDRDAARKAFEKALIYFNKRDTSLSLPAYSYRIPQGMRSAARSVEEQIKWEGEIFRVIKKIAGYSPEAKANEQYYIGLLSYYDGDYPDAVDALRQALKHLKKVPNNNIDLYSTYNLLSIVYANAGNDAAALLNQKLALEECPKSKSAEYFRFLINVAGHHLDLRQRADCRKYLKEARDFAAEYQLEDSEYWPYLFAVEYELFNAVPIFDSIRMVLDEQLAFYKKHPEFTQKVTYGRYINQEAALHIRKGEYDLADSYIQKAITFNSNNEHGITTQFLLSKIHCGQKRFEEGIRILHRLSCLSYKKGYELCWGFPQDSLLNSQDFKENFTHIEYIKDKASYYKYWYDHEPLPHLLELSNQHIALADSLLTIMKAKGSYPGSNRQIDEISEALCKVKISNVYSAQTQNASSSVVIDAFNTSEKVKQLAISERLHEELLTNSFGLPSSIITKERKYINRLVELLNDSKTASDSSMQKIESELQEIRGLQIAHHELIKKQYPDYYNLLFSPEPLKLTDIRAHIIGQNEVLLQFLEYHNNVYLVAINQEEQQFLKLDLKQPVSEVLAELRQQMSTRSNVVFPLLKRLYEELISPVSSLIGERDIVLIPDGHLWHIPFAALITKSAAPETVSADQHYLINDHNIRYLISGRMAYLQAIAGPKKQENAKGILCMSPLTSSKLGDFEQLKASKHTHNLLETLSNSYHDHYFQNEAASVGNFLRYAPKAALLHIGTHTQINDQYPESSFLVFNSTNSANAYSSLSAAKIYELNLPAQLAVLSACSTAEGTLRKGQGVTNLARAFAYAGCQNMIVNLWEIKDNTSKELMAAFYPALLEDKAAAATAFNTAQRTYIENAGINAHPAYWATSIYIGNDQPIALKNQQPGWLYLLLAFSGLGFFGYMLYRSLRKTNSSLSI